MFAFADPTELWLEIAPEAAAAPGADLWRPVAYSHPWSAYLNQLCLDSLLAWIQAEQSPEATAQTDRTIWEFVTGSAIGLGAKRLVLVPSEAIDQAELAVPQEWVDLPDWAGDYYLAVQVSLEPEAWIRVWGYASHQELKAGRYDPEDRTYCLDGHQLTQDWSALWVTLRFCPEAQTRAVLAPLPDLPAAQTESLLQRLSAVANPRLAIPFQLWGALIQQPRLRQQLYRQRVDSVPGMAQPPLRQNLSQWLDGVGQISQQLTAGWQQLEALLSPAELGWNLRSAAASEGVRQAKQLELAGQRLALVIQVSREPDGRLAIGVQVHPTGEQPLPAGLLLKLLGDEEAEQAEVLQAVQAGAQESYIQLRRFRCGEGTAFQVELELEGQQVTEPFEV
ncbi:MAG: DUF1822 family protein [Elainella sp.]